MSHASASRTERNVLVSGAARDTVGVMKSQVRSKSSLKWLHVLRGGDAEWQQNSYHIVFGHCNFVSRVRQEPNFSGTVSAADAVYENQGGQTVAEASSPLPEPEPEEQDNGSGEQTPDEDEDGQQGSPTEPSGPKSPIRAVPAGVNSRFQLCRFFLAGGSCPRGGSCTFAHGVEEHRLWTQQRKTQREQQVNTMQAQRTFLVSLFNTLNRRWAVMTGGAQVQRAIQLAQSMPADGSAELCRPPPAGLTTSPQLCNHALSGFCRKGAFCTFAHSPLGAYWTLISACISDADNISFALQNSPLCIIKQQRWHNGRQPGRPAPSGQRRSVSSPAPSLCVAAVAMGAKLT